MKKFLGTLGCLIMVQLAIAQTIKGKVSGAADQPLANATVELSTTKNVHTTITNDAGEFWFEKISSPQTLKISYTGYQTKTVELNNENMQNVVVNLTASNIFLEPLEIKAVRANERSPFAKTTITKQQIEKENLGQDIPFLLNKVPSVVINSDAGNGIGYTGIRIRGTDATRINVTLNGIPYNDAESQGTYFVDLPDLASSVNSIQVQRGVGTSTNGAGAFGATINLSTNEVNQKAYGEINNSYGSYNSWKHTVKIGSG
jgi:iron complex outermembrane receptor protein